MNHSKITVNVVVKPFLLSLVVFVLDSCEFRFVCGSFNLHCSCLWSGPFDLRDLISALSRWNAKNGINDRSYSKASTNGSFFQKHWQTLGKYFMLRESYSREFTVQLCSHECGWRFKSNLDDEIQTETLKFEALVGETLIRSCSLSDSSFDCPLPFSWIQLGETTVNSHLRFCHKLRHPSTLTVTRIRDLPNESDSIRISWKPKWSLPPDVSVIKAVNRRHFKLQRSAIGQSGPLSKAVMTDIKAHSVAGATRLNYKWAIYSVWYSMKSSRLGDE